MITGTYSVWCDYPEELGCNNWEGQHPSRNEAWNYAKSQGFIRKVFYKMRGGRVVPNTSKLMYFCPTHKDFHLEGHKVEIKD